MENKNILIKKEVIDQTVATPSTQGKRLLEPLASLAKELKLPINVQEDNGATDNLAELHENDGDLWYCISGGLKFICGGELDNGYQDKLPDGILKPGEFKAKSIKNGKEFIMTPGDWLWIPPGEPHHRFTTGMNNRFYMIKIPKKLS